MEIEIRTENYTMRGYVHNATIRILQRFLEEGGDLKTAFSYMATKMCDDRREHRIAAENLS